MMENPEVMKMVKVYLSYWCTYVQPLVDKEPKRYRHFTRALNEVGNRCYGPEFYLQFSIAVFQALDQSQPGHRSDKT